MPTGHDLPVGATLDWDDKVNNLTTRLAVRCEDDRKPLTPGPHVYSCGPLGTWNKDNPYVKLRFPGCGGKLLCIICTLVFFPIRKVSMM